MHGTAPDTGDQISVMDRITRSMPALSRSHRRLAEYALAYPLRVAMMPVDEFARQCGVSAATANRFAHALGLSNYPQFRTGLARGFEAALEPVERLRLNQDSAAGAAEIFAASLYEDQRNAERTCQTLDAETCERAVQAILDAKRIFILGFGSSGFLAGLLQRGLSLHCEVVTSVAGPGGASHAALLLSRLDAGDLVVAISFPRYLKDTVALVEAAKRQHARILALTDRATSPLGQLADVCLCVHSKRQLLPSSDTAVLGVIEALASAVAHRTKHSVHAATRQTESVMPWLLHEEGFS